MRRRHLVTVLLTAVQALVLAAATPVCAEETTAPAASEQSPVAGPTPSPAPVPQASLGADPNAGTEATAEPQAAASSGPDQPAASAPPEAAPSPADPVVAIIRAKLADPTIGKGFHADDLAALKSFYDGRSGPPLFITEMGFSTKGQQAIFEIEEADDWGLDAKAFDLPPPGEIPANAEAQALAEIKLGLAILKYARHARGGRVVPIQVSGLYDQSPPLKSPALVLTEIEAAEDPGDYLVGLQPKHEQFVRLRKALLKARGKDDAMGSPAKSEAASQQETEAEAGEKDQAKEGSKDDKDDQNKKKTAKGEKPAKFTERDIKRILLNMERWRWLPEDLGDVYVWNNPAEFMLYVVKGGKRIYADRTLVGTPNYATPVFSDEMETIVFNPDWIAPETVVKENLVPHLRAGNYSILKTHKLQVSYNGTPVNPAKVNWGRVNPLSYTFLQKGGPGNNLGKIKFLYPNRHVVYMHDTVPLRKKHFKEPVRLIGHECVRMEKPLQFAEILLAEGNAMPASKVKELWDKGVNAPVTLQKKIPVHMVYFTAVAGEDRKVSTFADVYGLDRRLALALFNDAQGFAEPAPDKSTAAVVSSSSSSRRGLRGAVSGIAGSLGFLD